MSNEHPTKTLMGVKAREAIIKGVNAIYEPVRLTLGPEGGNALLYRTYNRGPRITNDGVTIAKVIEPKDEFTAIAAQTFREAAEKTNEKAGDGTTTTIVIAGKLINGIFATMGDATSSIQTKATGVTGGVMSLKKDMLHAMKGVVDAIKAKAVKVETIEDLIKIATVAVEDAELGKVIAEIVWKVGVDGHVDVVEGYKGEIETEIIEGMRVPAKVGAKAFVTNPARFEMVAEQIPTVVTNFAFDNPAQLGFCNVQTLETNKLAIFAPSFSETVLLELIKAWKQNFHIFPICTPSLRTEQYQDLAIYTASTFVNKDEGMQLKRIEKKDLGSAEKIVVKDVDAREDAAVIGGGGAQEREVKMGKDWIKTKSAVTERIKILQDQVEETKSDPMKKLLLRRIASMGSAVGVIRVGAPSQAESLYRKLKIEDATYSCKAALQEGYVKGGGLCLKEIAEELDNSILTPALKAPYEQIQQNAEGTLEIPDEVIDPAKVVRLSVEHAISVAAHLVTAKIIIPEERDTSPGEGYREIAQALMTGVKFWARHQGLIKENELEMDRDNLKRFEENSIVDS